MTLDLSVDTLKELREELSDKHKAKNGIEYCIKLENQMDAIDKALEILTVIQKHYHIILDDILDEVR